MHQSPLSRINLDEFNDFVKMVTLRLCLRQVVDVNQEEYHEKIFTMLQGCPNAESDAACGIQMTFGGIEKK
jgi:hypothetical protein